MDCSKTIDFFAEAKRLCDSRATCDNTAHNEQCSFFKHCELRLTALGTEKIEEAFKHCELRLTALGTEKIEEAVEILQKWSNEHPKKTYAQDFFEKFPKAQACSDGSPFVCRERIYGGIHSTLENCDYTGACYKCWNEPMNGE